MRILYHLRTRFFVFVSKKCILMTGFSVFPQIKWEAIAKICLLGWKIFQSWKIFGKKSPQKPRFPANKFSCIWRSSNRVSTPLPSSTNVFQVKCLQIKRLTLINYNLITYNYLKIRLFSFEYLRQVLRISLFWRLTSVRMTKKLYRKLSLNSFYTCGLLWQSHFIVRHDTFIVETVCSFH